MDEVSAVVIQLYYINLWQNKKDQTFVEMHLFNPFFAAGIKLKLRNRFKKKCISTNVWPFLFCQGFRGILPRSTNQIR